MAGVNVDAKNVVITPQSPIVSQVQPGTRCCELRAHVASSRVVHGELAASRVGRESCRQRLEESLELLTARQQAAAAQAASQPPTRRASFPLRRLNVPEINDDADATQDHKDGDHCAVGSGESA